MRSPGTVARLLLGLALLVPLLALGSAAPASAHASLVSSDPAQGAVLDVAPEAVTLTFSESVAAVPASTKVTGTDGSAVDSSVSASGADLTVTIDGPVANGTLVVLWRVVSADGHPVSGSLSFSVGSESDVALPPPVDPDAGGAPAYLGIARVLGYLALLLAAGLLAFATLLLPAGSGDPSARARILTVATWSTVVAAVLWVVQVPLVAGYQLGGGTFDPGSWGSLAVSEYAVPAVVVAGLLVALLLSRRSGDARPWPLIALLPAVAAPAFTGHTRAESPLVVVLGADVLHLVAGATWLGGLVALGLTLPLLAREDDRAAVVLTRFSTAAAGVLAALVVTGSFLAWRILGSWSGLVDLAYGRLLLVKVASVLVAIALAWWNRRRLLPGLRAATRRSDREGGAELLRRTTFAEAGILVVVLLATGFLVDRSPEAELAAVERERGSVQSASLGEVDVRVSMTPLIAGTNEIALEMTGGGEPVEGLEAPVVSLESAGDSYGTVELTNVGPGLYEGSALLPVAGTWEVEVSLRLTEFENPVDTVEFVVDAS